MKLNFTKPVLLSVLSLTLGACASYPKSVAVDTPDNLPTLSQLQQNPEAYVGSQVVLGGRIVAVTNFADGSTVELLQLPLYTSGRPKNDVRSTSGRIRVHFEQLLDPEVYAKGQLLTVRGIILGKEDSTIGEHPYSFVSIDGNGIYLWPERDDPEVIYIMGVQNGLFPYYREPRYVPVRSTKPTTAE
jgi:outer membrane lipoprotein